MADSVFSTRIEVDDSALKEARGAVSGLESDLSDPFSIEIDGGNARRELESIADLARASLGAEALGHLGGALSEAGAAGVGLRKEMQLLSASTGAVGEDLDALRDRAEAAFKQGVGESLSEALDIAGKAEGAFSGVFDVDQMTVATERLGQLSAVTGAAPEEIAGKMRTLIQQFPELAQDAEKAFDLVALGSQKAKVPADDYLDTLAEYSGNFKSAGFGAEEMMGTLINASDAGAFSLDKVGDAVKELEIRATEGDIVTELETAFTDFGDRVPAQLQTKMLDVGDALQRGLISGKDALAEVAKAVEESDIDKGMQLKLIRSFAGTPAEDLGKDIGLRVFSNMVDPAAITAQAAEAGALMDSALTPPSGFGAMKRELDLLKEKAFELIGPYAEAAGSIATNIAGVAPGVLALSDKMTELGGLGGTVGKLGGAFSGLGGSIAGVGSKLGALATGPVGIIAGIAAVLVLAYQNSESFRTAIDGLLSTLMTALGPVLEQLGGILGQLIESLTPVLVAVGDLAGQLLTALMPAVTMIMDILGGLLGVVGDLLASILTALMPVIEGLATVLGAVIGVVADLVAGLVEGLLWVFQEIASFLADVFIAIWDALVAAFNAVVDAVFGAVKWFIDLHVTVFKVIGAVGEFAADLLGLGGVFDAVIGFIGDAVDAIGGFIGSIFGIGDAADEVEAKARRQKSSGIASAIRPSDGAVIGNMLLGVVSENIDEVVAEAEKQAVVIPHAVSRGVSRGTTAAKKTVKKHLEDFAEVVKSATRAAFDLTEQLAIEAEEDELRRMALQNASRLRLIDRGIDDEIAKIDERIATAAAKKAEGYEVEIKLEQEARTALEAQRQALHDQAAAEEIKRLEAFFEKRRGVIESENDRLVGLEEKRLGLLRDLANRSTLSGLQEATTAERSILDLTLQKDLDAIVEATPEYKAAAERLAEAFAAGRITEAQGLAELQAERIKIVNAGLDEEGSLIELTMRQAKERERALILDAIRQRRALEEAGLLAENDLYRSALLVRDSLYKGFYSEVDEGRKKEAKAELAKLDAEKEAIRERFELESISREEMRSQMADIADQERELIDELGGSTGDLLDQLNDGLSEAFQVLGSDIASQLEKGLSEIDMILFGTAEELEALGLSADDLTGKLVDTALNASLQIAAITAQRAVEGENILEGFAAASLDIMLQLLIKESKAIIALIFGKSVAANPLLGAAIAIPLIAGFAALTSAAKAAMAGGFFTGGFTGHGDPRDVAGFTHKEEFVNTAKTTRKYRPFLERLHAGEHPLEAALDLYGGFTKWTNYSARQSAPELRAFVADMVDRVAGPDRRALEAANRETKALQKQVSELVTVLQAVAGKSRQITDVTVKGKSKIARGDIVITYEQAKADSLGVR